MRLARQLVDTAPDSSLVLLDAVPRALLATPHQRAQYDILYAEAFYATYGFLDDSQTLSLATASFFREKERRKQSNLALLGIALLSTLALYGWAKRFQAQRQLLLERQEGERLLSAAEDLKARLGAQQSLGMLDRLCEQYYVYEGTDNLQPKILREVKAIVEGIRTDTKMQRSMEQSLNAACGGVMTRLREAFPKWKEEDFLLYLFLASGFSATTVATLMGKEKPYVYNRAYRLKERIRASGHPDADLLLSRIEK